MSRVHRFEKWVFLSLFLANMSACTPLEHPTFPKADTSHPTSPSASSLAPQLKQTPAPSPSPALPSAPEPQKSGQDLGYRFDPETRHCKNPEGDSGLNPGWIGECGDLSGLKIEESLAGKTLLGAKLTGAWISSSHPIHETSFEHADLSNAIFSGTQLRNVSFRHAMLSRADFRFSTIENGDFTQSDLSDSNFTRSQLIRTDFSRAQVGRMDMSRAILQESSLCGAYFSDQSGEAPLLSGIEARASRLGTPAQRNLRKDEQEVRVQEFVCAEDGA